MNTAFDESSRPTVAVEFQNSLEAQERDALIAQIRPAIITEIYEQVVQRIRACLEAEYRWAAQGRTLRARTIRLVLLKGDESIHDVAAQFKVSEHGVRKHRRALLKLRARPLVGEQMNERIE